MDVQEFVNKTGAYYQTDGRHTLQWRIPEPDGSFNAYKIMVSEIMLQQTQVGRVVQKFPEFLAQFPTMPALAAAPFDTVLGAWLGLGYNRRARYLWLAAQALERVPEPWQIDDLVACKGIGMNTAAAIRVYSYNAREIFVETNIRSVIIHHFFKDHERVSDREVLQKLAEINKAAYEHLPPRQWYWALMDYGSHLKRTEGNAAVRSAAYSKQGAFEGSRRQLRGRILQALHGSARGYHQLAEEIDDRRFADVVAMLQAEKLIRVHDTTLMLYNGFDEVA